LGLRGCLLGIEANAAARMGVAGDNPCEDRRRVDSVVPMDEMHEDVELSDGTCVHLRSVRPTDKHHFVAAMERASPETRRMRFFQTKRHFTEAELAYLTEVDGHDHVAIGALCRPPGGPEEAVGVGRYVRDPERPEVAEVALTIQDGYQRLGLGGAILDRLMSVARIHGVARFEMFLLADNVQMRELLLSLDLGVVVRQEDGADVYEIDLA
jgi:GNAT superfamily N-acetyltransferase